MGKIQKQSNGMYYERVVTWKKKPNYFNIFWGIIFLFFGIYSLVILIIISLQLPEIESIWHPSIIPFYLVPITFVLVMGLLGFILGGIALMMAYWGEDKEIKFKRINS